MIIAVRARTGGRTPVDCLRSALRVVVQGVGGVRARLSGMSALVVTCRPLAANHFKSGGRRDATKGSKQCRVCRIRGAHAFGAGE
jgi:hypothetical protein